MSGKIFLILYFLFGIFIIPQTALSQIDYNKVNQDDLGEVDDKLQELFFEALKQKGIENYDKAAQILLKCIEIDDDQSVFYYELGKNYNKLKNFGEAEDALKEAIKDEPSNEWYLDELYDVYAQQNDYNKAIKTLKQLADYHPDYKEDLVALYMRTKDYKDALKILDELDEKYGISYARDVVRNQIYAATGQKEKQIENLEERVEGNPDEEANYLALIYRYSENDDKEKAFETAKKLLEIKPNSQLVHLALYKFYLEEGNVDKAINSMKIALKSTLIKPEAKMMVLSDFVNFVGSHPEYEDDLVEITNLTSEPNGKSNVEVAQYFLAKGDKKKALEYYEEALKIEGNNYGILRNILLLHIDLEQYETAVEKSNKALESYPSQPVFYLVNGVSLNRLKRFKEAISTLEMGLDYIIEDSKMEADFYKQLSLAHSELGNTAKAKTFSNKANKLESTN